MLIILSTPVPRLGPKGWRGKQAQFPQVYRGEIAMVTELDAKTVFTAVYTIELLLEGALGVGWKKIQ